MRWEVIIPFFSIVFLGLWLLLYKTGVPWSFAWALVATIVLAIVLVVAFYMLLSRSQ